MPILLAFAHGPTDEAMASEDLAALGFIALLLLAAAITWWLDRRDRR